MPPGRRAATDELRRAQRLLYRLGLRLVPRCLGRRHARQALERVIEYVRHQLAAKEIGLSFVPERYNQVVTLKRVADSFSTLTGKDATRVSRLSGGSSLPSWRVDTRDNSYAVRLHTDAYSAYGQARLFEYLKDQGFPVPEVIAVGMHEEHYGLVLSWIQGMTFADALRAEPERADELGQLFGETHARLHKLVVVPEARERLPIVNDVQTPSGEPVILHLDYHLENVMTDGSTVTGVIDWENVRQGNACYDVARTLSVMCVDPGFRTLPQPARAVVRCFRRAYLSGYIAADEDEQLGRLAPFLGWAGAFMVDTSWRLGARDVGYIRRWASRWSGSAS